MKTFPIVLLLLLPFSLFGQQIRGKVIDDNGDPLVGANLHWLGTTQGTVTNGDGRFELPLREDGNLRVVVSFIGFTSDTSDVWGPGQYIFKLKQDVALKELEVKGKKKDLYISKIDPIKTEVISEGELTKGACCDLAGCFNTQASVQPTTTNVVTNAKELRILGLSGVYNQILVDGLPLIMGQTYTYGVSTIPGTLVRNIYIAKGANSVLQGFESISGQINVELKEPQDADMLLLNSYVNSFMESQFNANYSKKWKKWSTLLSAHATQPANKFDRDEDTFLDLPLIRRLSVYNKWNYGDKDEEGWHSRIGLRYVDEQRVGGQRFFDPNTDKGGNVNYGQTVDFTQPEIYTRTGLRINQRHHVVFLASAFNQNQNSFFGTTQYDAEQTNAYANIQHELNWGEDHTLITGGSYRSLERTETIAFGPDNLNRTYDGVHLKDEKIPGVFAENTFSWNNRSTALITGIRADKHNIHGWRVTPRALFKFNVAENTSARASIGTGWRTVNLFTENINLLASSRDVIITEPLNPESALNYGANLTHKIYGENVETQIMFDWYRTQFQNQIFPDYDSDPTQAIISNFTGTSISNGFQAELGMEFFEVVGAKIAYNFLDVFRMIDDTKFTLPFNSRHRLVGTFSIEPLSESWHIDMNMHYYGVMRIAKTSGNPTGLQLNANSQPYSDFNIQFTKNWTQLELYAGCENLFNFRQNRPILSWQNPFGPYFDTSTVWGPTRGREFYFGIRYKIK